MSSSNENLINEVPYVPWWMMGENGMLPVQVQGDQEQPEGIEPSYMIEDVLLPAVAGGTSLARAGLRKGAAALDEYLVKKGMEKAKEKFGASVVPKPSAPSVLDYLYGQNPAHMTQTQFGSKLNQLGQMMPERGAETLHGALLRELYQTQDPKQLVERMSTRHNVPMPNFEIAPELSGTNRLGAYAPQVNAMKVVPQSELLKTGRSFDPNASHLSLTAHEFEHAKDYYRPRPQSVSENPSFISSPEYLGRGSQQIQGENLVNSIISPSQNAQWYSTQRHYLTIEKGIRDGRLVPVEGGRLWDNVKGDYVHPLELDKLQDELFNQSRIGDPVHFLEMRSTGHFQDWPSLEGNFVQKTMAEQALQKGKQVNPELIEKFDLLKNIENYMSPYRNK